MDAVVRCRNIGLLYSQATLASDEMPDLTGIFAEDLTIPLGSRIAIVGASGSGKSTLLSIISGLKKTNFAGDQAQLALCLGNDRVIDLLMEEQPQPGDLGYVFQEPHLMKPLSAYLNFAAAGLIAGRDISYDTFNSFARRAGFGDELSAALANKQIAVLSGGQAQRIAVGRALAADPELLICDEPTSSLDSKTGRAILSLMRDWAKERGRTLIWVTHNLDQACEFADGYIITNQARVFTDGGKPFRFESEDVIERRKSLDARVAAFSGASPISKVELGGLQTSDAPATANAGRSGRSLSRKPASSTHSSSAIATFLARCVLADMFRSKPVAAGPVPEHRHARPSGPLKIVKPLLDRVASFSSGGMTAILLVGLMALYASLVSWWALDRYFEKRLGEPEVSHFVIAGSGKKTDGAPPFSALGLTILQEDLQKDVAGSGAGVPPPLVFGRRSNLLARFGRARDTDCPPVSGDNEVIAEMLVASSEEPLYRAAFSNSADGVQNTPVTAVVTQQFVNRLTPEGGGAAPKGFCYYDFGDTYVRISRVLPALPGSGSFVYHVAFEADTYLRLYRLHPPLSAYEGGRLRDPNYQTAAVYFDRSYAERLICEFTRNDNHRVDAAGGQQGPQPCADVVKREGYVTNTDVLTQLSSLVRTANATYVIIFSVVVMFFVLIVISTVFALNTFVLENEKFLSILKAFGFKLRHLWAIGWFQATILLGIALAILVMFLFVLEFTIVPFLATRFDIPVSWISFDPLILAASVGVLAAIAAIVVLGVLYVWWHRNRYVGDKLQAI